ncbi:50S ribosomal protein L25/general stress protein Ctc [Neisseriaceae bacterium CLB008]|nr:50S ribosomal protein L25/general stress protein Ctc [Neisseriaceae bacterium]
MSYEIKATLREEQGTGASRRLRREGKLPAVIYGDNQEAKAITVEHNAVFYALQNESFHSSVLKIELEGKTSEVIVRDFQMHPFKPAVQHIDFQVVNAKEEVKVRVPLHIVNADKSPAVKLQGGRISQLISMIEVIALPTAIPEFLDLDVLKAVGGQVLHISDIKFPEGVKSVALARDTDLAVASVSGKGRAIVEDEEEAPAEEAPAAE